jgi:hypothetical protein
VAAIDLYEGLQTASDTFVATTLNALSKLETLHAILLVCTLGILGYTVLLLLVPFRRQLLAESHRLAGLLSQLPQVRVFVWWGQVNCFDEHFAAFELGC